MRAVLVHLRKPDRSQIQSGYRGFVNDAELLIPDMRRLSEASWLIPERDYQAQLLGLCKKHAVSYATIDVETMSPWRQHP